MWGFYYAECGDFIMQNVGISLCRMWILTYSLIVVLSAVHATYTARMSAKKRRKQSMADVGKTEQKHDDHAVGK